MDIAGGRATAYHELETITSDVLPGRCNRGEHFEKEAYQYRLAEL